MSNCETIAKKHLLTLKKELKMENKMYAKKSKLSIDDIKDYNVISVMKKIFYVCNLENITDIEECIEIKNLVVNELIQVMKEVGVPGVIWENFSQALDLQVNKENFKMFHFSQVDHELTKFLKSTSSWCC